MQPLIKSLILLLFFATCNIDAKINRADNTAINGFSIVNEGRMAIHTVLLYLEDITLDECCNYCVKHLRCSSVSYSSQAKLCELNDMEFDASEADPNAEGWHNFATPTAIAGGWSEWRTVMTCSNKCDGSRKYQRTCNNPKPQHGGAKCVGDFQKSEKCDTKKCETCYGTRDDSYGNITVPKSGRIVAVKLIHVSGEVGCSRYSPGSSYWGCTNKNNDQKFLSVLTNSDKNVIFPDPSILFEFDKRYVFPSKSVYDKELILKNAVGIVVKEGDTLMVWYTQDLFDVSESDNSGKHCIKVEFIYK